MIQEVQADVSNQLGRVGLLKMVATVLLLAFGYNCPAQEAGEGPHTIIFNPGRPLPPPFLYSAIVRADATVNERTIVQTVKVQIRIVQGKKGTVSLGLSGTGDVIDVSGDSIASWAIRTSQSQRFLDLQWKADNGVQPMPQAVEGNSVLEDSTGDNSVESNSSQGGSIRRETTVTIRLRSEHSELPTEVDVAHLTPGLALGFDSQLQIKFAREVTGEILSVDGFAPLESSDSIIRFHSAVGGRLLLRLDRRSSMPLPVELLDTTLEGQVQENGKSMGFQLQGTAQVTKSGSRLPILSGNVAIRRLPESEDYRLVLTESGGQPAYEIVFHRVGSYPIALDFVAAIGTDSEHWRSVDFTMAAGAVVPLAMRGLMEELEFVSSQNAIVPVHKNDAWHGFLPATGRVALRWRHAQSTVESQLFFTTTCQNFVVATAGLLRQEQRVTYSILQGQLKSLTLLMRGPGEILGIEGKHIVGWEVVGSADERQLVISLNQPLTGNYDLEIHSQTNLSGFPTRVEGLCLQPQGAIRHSGFLFIGGSGSIRIEPTNLRGLSQIALDQWPDHFKQETSPFQYRFPSADYSFSILADRVQPEVNVNQLVVYQLTDTDRVISGEIELDIREAPIREWNVHFPEEYAIVSVAGANVAEYIAGSEAIDGRRNLKVLFSQEVVGRQLIQLRLEKNETAVEGQWVLPSIQFPEAKVVRGDIGLAVSPGFRATVEAAELLLEKPLSYFPRTVPNLQHAFRIRDTAWKATMKIDLLERSVQSDTFHLYALSQGTVYGSALINFFVTGAPVAEWQLTVPQSLDNLTVDGQDIRTWRREGDTVYISLHQPVMGAYTLLLTFEEKPNAADGSFQAGLVVPLNVQGDRGYVEVVSPVQVEMQTLLASSQLLVLDSLELPAEFRLLSSAPSLGTWQYTERPFELRLKVQWFEPGTTAAQVVEFSEANSRVSADGELVTDVVYYVKTRGQRTLRLQMPGEPVRLWAVLVNGSPVSARQSGDATLIPLPESTDPNTPVEVSLRLGKPAASARIAELVLPTVFAPVLKTQWNVQGDQNHLLLPSGGSVEPVVPVFWPSGFDWLSQRWFAPLAIVVALTLVSSLCASGGGWMRLIGLLTTMGAVALSAGLALDAFLNLSPPAPLSMSLPVLASGQSVGLQVQNLPSWRAAIVWPGVAIGLVGAVLFLITLRQLVHRALLRWISLILIVVGVLMQAGGATWFYALLSMGLIGLQLIPRFVRCWRVWTERKHRPTREPEPSSEGTSAVVTWILVGIAAVASMLFSQSVLVADETARKSASQSLATHTSSFAPDQLQAADSLTQQWSISSRDFRLTASARIAVTGRPGDSFLLLRAPAVLTQFDGSGLRLNKLQLPGHGLTYVVTIQEAEVADSRDSPPSGERRFSATFQYQLDAIQPSEGIKVLTGSAALHEIELQHDQAQWEVVCNTAANIETFVSTPALAASDLASESSHTTNVRILLGPGPASIVLRPYARDLASESTQFFVESACLYIPAPGVVDGRHRLNIRTSQGKVQQLSVKIPSGETVSSVDGPVNTWQFDAEKGRLQLEVSPPTPAEFSLTIETQRSLESLPSAVQLQPLHVEAAAGEVGLIGLAFASEAQPETMRTESLTPVNLGDFESKLLPNPQTVLHRVYRFGAEGGSLSVQVVPVAPEVRVESKQVLSFGDERIVLAVNFITEVTRTGVFQLSFPLPTGMEVESLTGQSLHHWSEVTGEGGRLIILHLNSKTIGAQAFSLTLAGSTPTDGEDWFVPRFEVNEAKRHSGELIVQPATGIRLRTVSRKNVSESDPRALGGQAQGALAFRLLQRDWSLRLGIDKLDAWVTGQVLHEVVLREGQTRSTLMADFTIQNAAVRSLTVNLQTTDSDEMKTIRVSGEAVSDFVRSTNDTSLWVIHFKRRVIGSVRFQIEYERRGERAGDVESLKPMEFLEARQLTYYYAVRIGGRLEVELGKLSQGWQSIDWSSVPQGLRDAGNRSSPALSLRALAPKTPLGMRVIRHSLAEALKLRVASGSLTSILSPTGDQLTAVDLTMEVIQRSSLSVQLPDESELFSIFVNGESVHSIRQSTGNAWQFTILPGLDDRTAQVRFIYSLTGSSLRRLSLVSPQLNVPLENIQWNVIAPSGYRLVASEGNLELVGQDSRDSYDRQSYLSSLKGKMQDQSQQATQLMEQANRLLQTGQQTKARWAFKNLANRYGLDAASNEDARVQLENLQTQQAIVGLNTRRQRLFLDNSRGGTVAIENEQLQQAASANPILQQEQLNFRPQEISQLLAGNSQQDNAVLEQIAGRLVQHQRSTEPAPQAIQFGLPEEGQVYSFRRAVQVAENAPLELRLDFHSRYKLQLWQWLVLGGLLMSVTAMLSRTSR